MADVQLMAPARILVVDDDVHMTVVVARTLERSGHWCRYAHSVAEALQTLSDQAIELIITDLNMPGGSGLELVAKARETDPDLAIVILSGVDDPATAREAIGLGAFGYMVKPFELPELQIAIMNALRRRELEIASRRHVLELEQRVEVRTAELRAVSDQLRLREERFRSLAAASPVGILHLTTQGVCEYSNARAQEILGAEVHELSDLLSLVAEPSDAAELPRHFEDAVIGSQEGHCEFHLGRATGGDASIKAAISPVIDDADGTIGAVVILEDITARRALERQLTDQAMHDPLTGMPNRRSMHLDLEARLETRPDQLVGVLLLDFDHFKLVNDTYGHEVGDQLITIVADRLCQTAPAGSLPVRLGGDEFVVVLSGGSEREFYEVARGIQAQLGQPMTLAGIEMRLGTSIGLACSAVAGRRPADLLRGADLAMHQAKSERGSIVIYTEQMAGLAAREVAIGRDLAAAIDAGDLTAAYQPIVDARTGRLVGVEALARWFHREFGEVGPRQFLGIAEAIGLAHRLDDHVLRIATSQLADWRRTGRVPADAFLSVNVAGSTLASHALRDRLAAALNSAGLDAGALWLEISERRLADDPQAVLPSLHRVRELGVHIALDDFGAAKSSLWHLVDLPVDAIKVDVALMDDLRSGRPHLVDAVIGLVRRCGLTVAAEGVERDEERHHLVSLGCDWIQGHLEPPRVWWRRFSLRRMSACLISGGRAGTRRSFVSGRCGWCWRPPRAMAHSGRRSVRSPRSWGPLRRRCAGGSASTRSITGPVAG